MGEIKPKAKSRLSKNCVTKLSISQWDVRCVCKKGRFFKKADLNQSPCTPLSELKE